ncbi:MAG TPA: PLP-dependent aminotransferase family protein [Gammaproteobacteria bacterium]
MAAVAPSFIREILKVAGEPGTISFAGGLPDPRHFPVAALKAATLAVFDAEGATALQYGASEGDLQLRQWIAAYYRQTQQLDISPAEILITNGSQQALDLLGKVLVDEGDGVLIEEPGYLGALQALSLYQPRFLPVPLQEEGPDLARLEHYLERARPKLFYTTPNFQNPSGLSYSYARRGDVAQLLGDHPTLLIEDDPYGDLRFCGKRPRSFKQLRPEHTVLLGSFSKTIAPSLRVGWLVAPAWLMKRLVIAKQAADLHTSGLNQRILVRYLQANDYAGHVRSIAAHYRQQMEAMQQAIARHFPAEVAITHPEGGMFLWATLNTTTSARQLFERSIEKGVAFVPGHPFYVNRRDGNTLRLNFTNSDPAAIERGIAAIGQALREV